MRPIIAELAGSSSITRSRFEANLTLHVGQIRAAWHNQKFTASQNGQDIVAASFARLGAFLDRLAEFFAIRVL
jgi:hypothetical protein